MRCSLDCRCVCKRGRIWCFTVGLFSGRDLRNVCLEKLRKEVRLCPFYLLSMDRTWFFPLTLSLVIDLKQASKPSGKKYQGKYTRCQYGHKLYSREVEWQRKCQSLMLTQPPGSGSSSSAQRAGCTQVAFQLLISTAVLKQAI